MALFKIALIILYLHIRGLLKEDKEYLCCICPTLRAQEMMEGRYAT